MKKPEKLYHATYEPLIPLIQKEGLGGKSSKKNWEDSKKGVTYWALNQEVAESYAESSEIVDEDWLDQIVIFSCDISNFDQTKLFVDKNVQDNDGLTLEYHGIIPFDKLKRI